MIYVSQYSDTGVSLYNQISPVRIIRGSDNQPKTNKDLGLIPCSTATERARHLLHNTGKPSRKDMEGDPSIRTMEIDRPQNIRQ